MPLSGSRLGRSGPALLLCSALAALLCGCATTTPLLQAAARGDTDAVRDLIEAGAEVNTEDSCTTIYNCGKPLIEAAKYGHLETVRVLLRAGASPYGIDGQSRSARDYAQEKGYDDVSSLLKQAEDMDKAYEDGLAAVTREDVARIVQAALDAAENPKGPPVTSDVDQPRYRGRPEDPDAAAIVVGVEKYAGLPDAEFAERDATAVRDHLYALGFPKRNVVFATNEQVTKTGLTKYVEAWLPKRVGERSTVFFYFSGHGAPELKTGRAYLLGSDGDPKYVRLSGYPLSQLYQSLARLKAKRIIVALDSCFSGAGGRSVLAPGTRPLVIKVGPGMVADPRIVTLSASGADQISGILPEQGHGLFTYYLLRGLNGEAAGPGSRLTLGSLYDYLVPRVQDAARRDNRDQTPQLFPREEGRAVELR